jgi:MFS family permease
MKSGLATFLVIWSGQLVSQAGTAMTRFALLIWAYELTGRATTVALLGFCSFVPFIAASPFAGVWVDRLDRRRVMLWADLGAGISTAGLLVLHSTGLLAVWHLFAAEALAGLCEAFQIPAFTAASSLLVAERHFARASGLRATATMGAEAVAPFVAGVALVHLGLRGVLLIDLATFLVALITLLAVAVPRPASTAAASPPRAGFRGELAAGGGFIWRSPGLLGLLLIFAGMNLFAAITYYAILPPMVLARTGKNTLALASVQSANGVAGVAGGAIMSVWGGPRRKIHGVLAGAAVSFVVGDLLFAMGRTPSAWVVAALLGSAFVPVITSCNQAIWQAKIPAALQGRVFGICSAVRVSMMPAGYLIGGLVADFWMEPAMAEGGWLAPWLGGAVGVGPGAGMAAMFLATAGLGSVMSLSGYLFPAVRNVEDR